MNETYSVGYGDEARVFFNRRNAASHARFFLPYLKKGMHILDCGCGPGSISAGLAEIVDPGNVVGLDLEPTQLAAANKRANINQSHSAYFACGNTYTLPFAEHTFDAVFIHGVLEHLSRPLDALEELKRVLKPTGLIGARHTDFGGFIIEPAPPPLDQFILLFEKLMIHNGGDPYAGRHQPALFREAGYDIIEVDASYDCWTKNRSVTQASAQFLADFCAESSFANGIISSGISNQGNLKAISAAFLKWGENSGAFAAEAWGEIVARK